MAFQIFVTVLIAGKLAGVGSLPNIYSYEDKCRADVHSIVTSPYPKTKGKNTRAVFECREIGRST